MWCSAGRAAGAGPAGGLPGSGRDAPSGPRGRACRPSRDRPTMSDRTRSPLATRRRHPPAMCMAGRRTPATAKVTQAHREREQAQGTLGTADHIPAPRRPVKAGSLHARPQASDRPPERATPGSTSAAVRFSSRPHATDPGSAPGSAADGTRWRCACSDCGVPTPRCADSVRGGADGGAGDTRGVHVRIGIQASYSGGFQETAAEIRDLEAAGLDVAAVAEVYTFDAVSQLGYLAAVTERVELLSAHLPDLQPHAGADGDDGRRPGLRLRRPVHPRPGRLRAAGDRGLARRPLRRAAAAHPGDRRDLPAGVAPRAARPRRARTTRSRCRPTRAPAWASR